MHQKRAIQVFGSCLVLFDTIILARFSVTFDTLSFFVILNRLVDCKNQTHSGHCTDSNQRMQEELHQPIQNVSNKLHQFYQRHFHCYSSSLSIALLSLWYRAFLVYPSSAASSSGGVLARNSSLAMRPSSSGTLSTHVQPRMRRL